MNKVVHGLHLSAFNNYVNHTNDLFNFIRVTYFLSILGRLDKFS